jgi:hypothetical protein
MDGSALNASMEGADATIDGTLSDAVAQANRERKQQQRNAHMQQRIEVLQALHLQQYWQHMHQEAAAVAAQRGAPIVECGRLNNGGGGGINGGGGGSDSAPQVGRAVHPSTPNEHALIRCSAWLLLCLRLNYGV